MRQKIMVQIVNFLLLAMGHLIGDYIIQDEKIALGKNPNIDVAKYGIPWWVWMSAHSAGHGLIVFALTGNEILAIVEFFGHWAIDYGKVEDYYGLLLDQTLHLTMKACYVGFY